MSSAKTFAASTPHRIDILRPTPIGSGQVRIKSQTLGQSLVIGVSGHELLPPVVSYRGVKYSSKSELHITVIGQRVGLKGDRVVPAFRDSTSDLALMLLPANDFRSVRDKDGRASLIQRVDIPGFDEVYARIERALLLTPLSLPRTPPHVTLFYEPTKDPASRGVGLYSQADMDASQPINLDEVVLPETPYSL